MASFYNNYYRYYRPYPPHISKHHLVEDKSSFTINSILASKELPLQEDFSNNSSKSSNKEEKSSRYYSFGPINFKNPLFNDIEEPIFEILGIQLYLDDIIILGLLFFLYQEGVQDEMLYIALILLLLG